MIRRPRAARAKAPHPRDDGAGQPSDRLEILLGKAARLMAKEGYHHTSMRDVARDASCSLAGLYHYFSSKEDLLFQVQHRVFASLLAAQEQSLKAPGPLEERLRLLVQNHLSFFTRHAAELKVCTFELESLSGASYRRVEELRRRYYRLVADLVGELATRSGAAPSDVEVRRLTLFVFGILNWIFMWFDPARDTPIETLGDEIVNLVLYGLCGQRATTDAGQKSTALGLAG
ncbi:MAG: TetR/AcrR family transcriptional regulator [Deltaproteobacteria bacterium]|nr:TetR/AcrR family transcriptional regulator [Deltaproteobacteria bacterium]